MVVRYIDSFTIEKYARPFILLNVARYVRTKRTMYNSKKLFNGI
jgi:hypothetical protein